LDITPEQHAEEEEPIVTTRRRQLLSPSLLRRIVIGVVALMILPYVLVILYALPFIHPISTLMLADLLTLRGYDRHWSASTRFRRTSCDRS